MVTAIVLWPSISCTTFGFSPRPSCNVAAVCLRSWTRIRFRPAFASARWNDLLTLAGSRGRPSWRQKTRSCPSHSMASSRPASWIRRCSRGASQVPAGNRRCIDSVKSSAPRRLGRSRAAAEGFEVRPASDPRIDIGPLQPERFLESESRRRKHDPKGIEFVIRSGREEQRTSSSVRVDISLRSGLGTCTASVGLTPMRRH
jgi:hypothetical protein